MSQWKLSQNLCKIDESLLGKYDLVLLKLLSNRNICSKDEIEKFLNPSLDYIPSVLNFNNIEEIVNKINDAIKNNKKIYIHGDYDVDGMAATAILWEYLYKNLKADVMPYIPNRVDEGYGLTTSSLTAMSNAGAQLIITVDCGIRDAKLIEEWKEKGLDFIVTDHHELPEDLPNCLILHPKFSNKECFKGISGATVSWFLVCAMEYFRDKSNFDIVNVRGLDLVAISILSDVMDVRYINRHLLSFGIEKLRFGSRKGLLKLFERLEIQPKDISVSDLVFKVIPSLNSVGRIGDPLDSVRLMITDSDANALKFSNKIQKINLDRKIITQQVFDQAMYQVQNRNRGSLLYWALGEDWHEGVVGIVAGRISSQFKKVAVVISKKKDVSVGSIRSVQGVSIVQVLDSLSSKLVRYGGHDMAAGFTVANDFLDDFIGSLENEICKFGNCILDMDTDTNIDLELSVDDLGWNTYLKIMELSPFGNGNPEPLILLKNVNCVDVKIVGNNHLKLKLKGNYNEIDAIGFGKGFWKDEIEKGKKIDINGYLGINKWNDTELLQFKIEDIRVY